MDILFLEIDTENEWAVCSLGPTLLGSHVAPNKCYSEVHVYS